VRSQLADSERLGSVRTTLAKWEELQKPHRRTEMIVKKKRGNLSPSDKASSRRQRTRKATSEVLLLTTVLRTTSSGWRGRGRCRAPL
jgi:hypothetical protein